MGRRMSSLGIDIGVSFVRARVALQLGKPCRGVRRRRREDGKPRAITEAVNAPLSTREPDRTVAVRTVHR